MTEVRRKFNIDFSKKQSEAWEFLSRNDRAVELMFGGAKYGGKSVFGCAFCYLESIRLIKLCNIKKSTKPVRVGFMGRMVGQDFNTTTLDTWFEMIPENLYEIKGKPAEIIIENRVKIYTGGLDRQETINKFNSAELAFFFLDQGEEVPKDKTNLLRAATYWRKTINGIKLPGKGLITANPAQCWLKEEFILNPKIERKVA